MPKTLTPVPKIKDKRKEKKISKGKSKET